MTDELERIRSEYIRRDASGTSNIYTYANPAFLFHIQEREHAILDALRDSDVHLPATDVLEIGCGTGHILQRFLDFGARRAVGVELMPHRIAMGQAKNPLVSMICADGGDVPLPAASFGLVMQYMCLSSVLDAGLRSRIASEMWRVTAPGGTILSYDLRPSSIVQRAIGFGVHHFPRAKANGATGSGGVASVVTPTEAFGLDELRRLFPHGSMRAVSTSLDFNLASLAGVSRLFASLLSTLPLLRTHWLVLIRKPRQSARSDGG